MHSLAFNQCCKLTQSNESHPADLQEGVFQFQNQPLMRFFFRLLMFIATLSHIRGFTKPMGPVRASMRSMSMAKAEYQLVLLRHGQSTWNNENKFTGWYDCPLSDNGRIEAAAAGKLLQKNGYKFDMAYSSYLQRAIRTLWYALEETNCMHIPIKTAWELNER